MSIVIEIYMLMLKSATDVGILRLTTGCEWNSLQRFEAGIVSDMQVHAIVIAAGLKPRSSVCRGGAPVPARASFKSSI